MKEKNLNFEVNVPVKINLNDFIDYVASNIDYKDIENFIKKLDVSCQDWGITENLYRHFKKLHYQYIEIQMKEYGDGVCPQCKEERLYVYDENDGFYIACRNCDWKEDL